MHDLSLYILEMIENSLRAGAGRVAVRVEAETTRDELSIAVEDDGPGLDVSPEQATDPFFTTKAGKKTGLGLPLFREAAEAAGGHLTMRRSPELGGVAIEAILRLSHVDRPPLGDVVQTVAVMAATNPQASLSLEVGAGAETCLAQGAELAAGGPATGRCEAILASIDARPALTGTADPTGAQPALTGTADPTGTQPAAPETTQTVEDTVDLQQQRSVG
ncbi:MAG: ATP-binding protein [Thermoleophilia bacterium]